MGPDFSVRSASLAFPSLKALVFLSILCEAFVQLAVGRLTESFDCSKLVPFGVTHQFLLEARFAISVHAVSENSRLMRGPEVSRSWRSESWLTVLSDLSLVPCPYEGWNLMMDANYRGVGRRLD